MSGGEYLSDEREATLVAILLDNLDHDDAGERNIADCILTDLIEAGLSNPDGGPRAFMAWVDAPGALSYDRIRNAYLDVDPVIDSPSGWSFRESQENGDQVDCPRCGEAVDDDMPIANDDEGFAYHAGCLAEKEAEEDGDEG